MFSKLSTQQLSDLLPFFRSLPKLALFANAAKFEVEKTLPNFPCDFYELESKNSKYFYCYMHNLLPDHNRPVLMIGNKGKVNEDDVIEGLKHLKEVEPDFAITDLVVAVRELCDPARKFMKGTCNLREGELYPCYNFFIAPSVHPQILAKIDQISLPTGFSIGSTRLTDAEIVNSTWKFATPEDILQQKEKIARLPTVCIFHNDRPVAFEMIGLHGQLSHQYTFPEYRNQGLGGIIESSILAKCISHEICPVKSVEILNEAVAKRSLEHPLWKVVSDEDGVPVVFDYVHFYPKD